MRCKVIKNARKSTLFLPKNQQKGLELGEVTSKNPPSYIVRMFLFLFLLLEGFRFLLILFSQSNQLFFPSRVTLILGK